MTVSSLAKQNIWTRGDATAIILHMSAYRKGVGVRLRDLRRSRNWSQEDAAHAMGTTTSTWGRWERGQVQPYERHWQRIAEVFGEEAAREARGTPPGFEASGKSQLDRIEAKLDQVLEGMTATAADYLKELRSLAEMANSTARERPARARDATGRPRRRTANGS